MKSTQTTLSLAEYIADYINTELERGHKITKDTVLDAMEAYAGGAR